MSIIWILLIIAVAVAPLMSALPSEAQRYEAKIRAHAMEQGITIKLGQTPEIPARFRLPLDLSLVAYRRRRLERDQRFDESRLAVKSLGNWVSVPLEKPISEGLLSLPDGAWIAELGVDYVSIFWDEKVISMRSTLLSRRLIIWRVSPVLNSFRNSNFILSA